MKSPICDMLGIEFPLLAFSHCRDVVAAVSRAGGFGVLGATAHSPETIEQELKWIDDHTDGKPYGLDVLIPENISTAGEKDVTWKSLEARISPQHRDFTRNLLKKYGIELTTTNVADNQPIHWLRRLEVFLDRRDRRRLVGSLQVREGRCQLVVPQGVGTIGLGTDGFTRRIELDELEGHFADRSPHPPPRLLPLARAKASQEWVDASA